MKKKENLNYREKEKRTVNGCSMLCDKIRVIFFKKKTFFIKWIFYWTFKTAAFKLSNWFFPNINKIPDHFRLKTIDESIHIIHTKKPILNATDSGKFTSLSIFIMQEMNIHIFSEFFFFAHNDIKLSIYESSAAQLTSIVLTHSPKMA